MNTTDIAEAFKPAFCNRGSECQADRISPYCAACGADIAGYLSATTLPHAPVPAEPQGQIPQTALAVVQVEQTPAATTPIAALGGGEPGESKSIWRDPLVLGSFAGAVLAGAVGALLLNLA